MKKETSFREHAVMVERLLFIGILLLFLSTLLAGSVLFWPLFLGGLGISVWALVYRKKHLRCPHCGRFPSVRLKDARFCPNCGKPLDPSEGEGL